LDAHGVRPASRERAQSLLDPAAPGCACGCHVGLVDRRGRLGAPIRHRMASMTEHVLIYDRDCGLCRTIVAGALALDRRRLLRPPAVQTDEAERLLRGMTDERRMDSFHMVAPEGRVDSAGAGLAALAALLPGLGAAGRVLQARPALSERAYRLV